MGRANDEEHWTEQPVGKISAKLSCAAFFDQPIFAVSVLYGGVNMSSSQNHEHMENARFFTEQMIKTARSDVAAKLSKVDEACREIIKSGGLVSMPSVRSYLSTTYGITIAAQTLCNKTLDRRTGKKVHSPLRQVIDKYVEIQRLLQRKPGRPDVAKSLGSAFLSDCELTAIEDHQVRHKVQLLLGRVRNLNTQLNEARAVQNLPSLPASAFSAGEHPNNQGSQFTNEREAYLGLDEEELEAIEDFLKETSMRRRALDFDEIGTLRVKIRPTIEAKTVVLSKPEFQRALRKILHVYSRS